MKAKIDVFSVKDEKPLPSVINSGHGDIAFSPAENLGGFFFSSMRPGGFGGWDLYFISYKNNKWGTPVNLGPDINTIWHEMFITQNGKVYYFSSNRQGGIGYYDIYGINSSSIATNKEMYRARMENKRKMNAMADVKPDYMESFRGENRVERIYIRTQKMTNKEGRESESDFPLVYFDYQSAKLKSKYNPQLNEIASYLKTNTDKSLKIIGHTDERGGDDYNCNLSFNRAKSVLNYLVGKNIKKKRLKILPMGKKMPLQSQDGEEETNAKNRRVEFNIIDN
jgi:outer membrane protein OmpA-like peptidoglycan-associated protein